MCEYVIYYYALKFEQIICQQILGAPIKGALERNVMDLGWEWLRRICGFPAMQDF